MSRVVHVVVTGNFAGVERYVSDTAAETAARGWDVTVVGGDPIRMRESLPTSVRWLPGATPLEARRSLRQIGTQDICHAHMTSAEAVALGARRFHHAPVVSTRHFSRPRGSSPLGRALAPRIASRLARQIAVSEYVAQHLEAPPDAVIPIGVPRSPLLWSPDSKHVLVMQRLEREKDTLTALRAWHASRLWESGWSLRVVGDGAERASLEQWVAAHDVPSVDFSGWTDDPAAELAAAGILLAPGSVDSFGLAVVEAMAAGVPVVACASGGHLETVGLLESAPMFPPGDAETAAVALRSLDAVERRQALSGAGRSLVELSFGIDRHVDRLLYEYQTVLGEVAIGELRELVVCSLEPWDDVWRRNQFFVDALLRRNPSLRILFVEPPADPLHDLSNRHRPGGRSEKAIRADGRLVTLRPLKPLPRRLGGISDAALQRQVLGAARRMGFTRPVLWINDVTYAPLIAQTGWPSLYDVTDDWLLAPFGQRELDRLTRLDGIALADARSVVVCSPALAETRGAGRDVALIPNGVDVEHFRRPRPRPADLPSPPTAVYVGTLHEARLDVALLEELARSLETLQVVLVGPDALDESSRHRLVALPNIHVLGSRPYEDVPAYLQHADVVIVPHLLTPFTESLDPIKAYECRVVDTPTVATPVSGFRGANGQIEVVDPALFAERVQTVLSRGAGRLQTVPSDEISWEARAARFEDALVATLAPRA